MTTVRPVQLEVPARYRRQAWTDRQREILAALYPYMGAARVASTLGRSLYSVYSEAQRMGLQKDPSFYTRSSNDTKRSHTAAEAHQGNPQSL